MLRCRRLLSLAEQVSHSRMSIREASSQSQSWDIEGSVKQGVSKVASMFEKAVSPGSAWSPDKMPDLSGKKYLITGANSGIGFQAARQLAQSNAAVTIASRNEASGQRCARLLEAMLSAAGQTSYTCNRAAMQGSQRDHASCSWSPGSVQPCRPRIF